MNPLIIIPAYNEQATIAAVVEDVRDHGYDYVVVNDGSSDRTLAICREQNLNVLDIKQNLGIGGAVQAGHMYARDLGYDLDIQFDGDGQHDIDSIPALVECIANGADLAIGSRFLSDDNRFYSTSLRRVGIRWLSGLIKLFTHQNVTDPTSGFRACGKRAIELFSRDYPMDYPEPESIVTAYKHGLTIRETGAKMHERQGGLSSIQAKSSVYYMIKVTLALIIMGSSFKKA